MVINRQQRVSVDEEELSRFARRLSRTLQLRSESFAVALVSDQEIARLNHRYRGRSQPTDVLSFAAGGNGYRGDVVISVETARRQARCYCHSLEEEVKLLMLHGVLHLLGYDHETDGGQMNRREHALRRRLGLE
ncbi:MAG: rRNA maturation RNase YbeY [Acidobacteria bacterium]|nr:rRNA maturation RNase YbeY [Acidobacteriota bacterium]